MDPRRRAILGWIAAAFSATLPAVAATAPSAKRVGVFGISSGLFQHWKAEFPKAFAANGFDEGRNLELLWFEIARPFEGSRAESEARAHGIRDRITRANLDCIITHADPGTHMLQEASRRTPIVTDVPDPVASGYAQSLAHPGGNITGLHGGGAEKSLKTIELFRKVAPGLSCVAWIGWAGLPDSAKSFENAARILAVRMRKHLGEDASPKDFADLRSTFASLRRDGCTAAFVEFPDPATIDVIASLALEHRIVLCVSGAAEKEGVLLDYGHQRFPEHASGRRLPAIAVRILRGEPAGNIPFEGPSRYTLVVNLKTAAKIGVTVPPEVLVLADEVVR